MEVHTAVTTSAKVRREVGVKRDAGSELAEHRLSVLELAKKKLGDC
jgi:hypothetical protein